MKSAVIISLLSFLYSASASATGESVSSISELHKRSYVPAPELPYCDEPVPPPPKPTPPPPKPPCVEGPCIDFGIAGSFDAVVFGYYQGSSDVQGRLAVQGSANLSNGFSAADQIPIPANQCQENNLIVGGSLNWQVGRLYSGNIVVGQASNVKARDIMTQCQVLTNANAFDFNASKAYLSDLSKQLAGRQSTVKSKTIDINLKMNLEFSSTGSYEVIELQANDMGEKIKEIGTVSGVAANSLIVFNIRGANASLKNMNMEALAPFNVMFNFPDAAYVDIKGIAVRGGVLAPNAELKDATGVIWGPTYVKSMTGPIQINLKPIQCKTVCTPPKQPYQTSTSASAGGSAAAGTSPSPSPKPATDSGNLGQTSSGMSLVTQAQPAAIIALISSLLF